MTTCTKTRTLRLLTLSLACVLLLDGVAVYAATESDPGEVIAATDSDGIRLRLDSSRPDVQPPRVPRTTAPTTTTTTAPPPPPTTTTPPQPPPPPTPPPTAAPATTPPPPPPPPESAYDRVLRAYSLGVPAAWRGRIEVRFEMIEGSTSWAYSNGVIAIGSTHANGDFNHLADVIAHEFGHQVAYRYGTGEYPGAAPAGWPAPERRPEEAWADCVQIAFTGRSNPSHGLPACAGEQRSWAANWLAAPR